MSKELLIWQLLALWEVGKCFIDGGGAGGGGAEHQVNPCSIPQQDKHSVGLLGLSQESSPAQ